MEGLQPACIFLSSVFLSAGVFTKMVGETAALTDAQDIHLPGAQWLRAKAGLQINVATVTGHNDFCFSIIHLPLTQ